MIKACRLPWFGAAAAVFAAILLPLGSTIANQSDSGQTTEPPPAKFDVVSVKMAGSGSRGEHSDEESNPGRLRITGSMHRLVIRAYGITDHQLGKEPEWFKTNLYTIEAVTSAPSRSD